MKNVINTNAAGTNFSAPSGSASVLANIPLDASGQIPKFIRVAVASGAIYFHQDSASTTATTTDPIVGVSDATVFKVTGTKYSAYGIGGIVVGVVTPLEDAC